MEPFPQPELVRPPRRRRRRSRNRNRIYVWLMAIAVLTILVVVAMAPVTSRDDGNGSELGVMRALLMPSLAALIGMMFLVVYLARRGESEYRRALRETSRSSRSGLHGSGRHRSGSRRHRSEAPSYADEGPPPDENDRVVADIGRARAASARASSSPSSSGVFPYVPESTARTGAGNAPSAWPDAAQESPPVVYDTFSYPVDGDADVESNVDSDVDQRIENRVKEDVERDAGS